MDTTTQTTSNHLIKNVGFLAAKGLFYLLFGLALLFIAPDDRSSLFWLYGLLLALSGASSIGFGLANQRIEPNSRWFVVSGVIDLIFSAVIFLYVGSNGMNTRFWDVMVFWAILYATAQGVQAMYPFEVTPSASVLKGPVARLHLLSALVAVAFFGTLQFVSVDQASASGWPAFLMMILGGLLLLITPRLRTIRTN